MRDFDPDTITQRPFPQRPKYGWLAWEATIGYIGVQYSPDATLRLEISPNIENQEELWGGVITWADVQEKVQKKSTLISVLQDLWKEVMIHHTVFKDLEASTRQPAYYKDDEWIDNRTNTMVQRLIRIIRSAFKKDWRIIITYRPLANPDVRLQARLLANQNQILIGGTGASLYDACSDLYHNITSIYLHTDES